MIKGRRRGLRWMESLRISDGVHLKKKQETGKIGGGFWFLWSGLEPIGAGILRGLLTKSIEDVAVLTKLVSLLELCAIGVIRR